MEIFTSVKRFIGLEPSIYPLTTVHNHVKSFKTSRLALTMTMTLQYLPIIRNKNKDTRHIRIIPEFVTEINAGSGQFHHQCQLVVVTNL